MSLRPRSPRRGKPVSLPCSRLDEVLRIGAARQAPADTGTWFLSTVSPGAVTQPRGPAAPPYGGFDGPGGRGSRPGESAPKPDSEYERPDRKTKGARYESGLDWLDGTYSGDVANGVPEGIGTYDWLQTIEVGDSEARVASLRALKLNKELRDLDRELTQAKTEYARAKETEGFSGRRQTQLRELEKRVNADRERLEPELQQARAAREAAMAVSDDAIDALWRALSKNAGSEGVTQNGFTRYLLKHREHWRTLQIIDSEMTANDARDKYIAPAFLKANEERVRAGGMLKTDDVLTEAEFKDFFRRRRAGEVDIDNPAPPVETVNAQVSYEGQWVGGVTKGQGLLQGTFAGKDGAVNRFEASGMFEPNFQPRDASVEYVMGSNKVQLESVTVFEYPREDGGLYSYTGKGSIRFDMQEKGTLRSVGNDARVFWDAHSLSEMTTSSVDAGMAASFALAGSEPGEGATMEWAAPGGFVVRGKLRMGDGIARWDECDVTWTSPEGDSSMFAATPDGFQMTGGTPTAIAADGTRVSFQSLLKKQREKDNQPPPPPPPPPPEPDAETSEARRILESWAIFNGVFEVLAVPISIAYLLAQRNKRRRREEEKAERVRIEQKVRAFCKKVGTTRDALRLLEDADWSRKSLKPADAIVLAHVLVQEAPLLTSLNLQYNGLGVEGAKAIAGALPSCKLTSLDLYDNKIGDEGAKAIAAVLPNCQLTSLNLRSNNLGAEGAAALAKGLPGSKLEELDLTDNAICGIKYGQGTYTSAGIDALAAALATSKLTSLKLWYNHLGAEGAAALAKGLPGSKLEKLDGIKSATMGRRRSPRHFPRRTSPSSVILEEAAYCDQGLISEVVVPLLSMSKSVLLCISTLLESGNHYSKMFQLSDDLGRPLFEQIQITLVCSECMKTDTPEKCTHKMAEMPRKVCTCIPLNKVRAHPTSIHLDRWLSSSKMEVVKSILSDDPAMLLRESMGLASDGTHKAFRAADVDAFLARPRLDIYIDIMSYNSRGNTNHFVLSVDPSGGGASAFAVASMCQLPNGQLVVLGVDTLRTKDVRHTHTLVIEHLASVRKIRGLEDATAVLCLESNLAFEAQHIVHALERAGVRKWVVLSEGAQGTIGWLTTNERKEAMCFQLRDALSLGNIALSTGFFSNRLGVTGAIKTIRDELVRYAILVEPAKTLFGRVRKTYSGKIGGEQDDLAIVLQLAISALRCFYTSDRYSKFRPID